MEESGINQIDEGRAQGSHDTTRLEIRRKERKVEKGCAVAVREPGALGVGRRASLRCRAPERVSSAFSASARERERALSATARRWHDQVQEQGSCRCVNGRNEWYRCHKRRLPGAHARGLNFSNCEGFSRFYCNGSLLTPPEREAF